MFIFVPLCIWCVILWRGWIGSLVTAAAARSGSAPDLSRLQERGGGGAARHLGVLFLAASVQFSAW